jgi:hypothetical protein
MLYLSIKKIKKKDMKKLDFITKSKIDNLIDQIALVNFTHNLELISDDLIEEGFEESDIKQYLIDIIEEHLG